LNSFNSAGSCPRSSDSPASCAINPIAKSWPARKLLERLLEQEMNERDVRRFERHRIASGLSPDKQLSSFDFSAVPSISRARIMALTEGHEWLDRGVNLLAFGPPGSGKSHLLGGIGHALIDAGRRVLFTRCSDLVQRLQAARRDLRMPNELAKLDRFDLLILDDLELRPTRSSRNFRAL
jgi:DNA replication protein DnaC